MAFCVLHTGRTLTLSKEQGLRVWNVLQGSCEPENAKQERFVASIKRLYLNREYAPADYLEKYPKGKEVMKQERMPLW